MTSPGVVLSGRYTLLREAWRTPRASIWQARDATLDRRVHVMLLDDRFLEDRARRRAFIDEAAQLAAITDPYLAAVYDIGTDPPFVVFEDAGGGRLVDRLRSGPLEPAAAARVASNVARGIQALELRGEVVPHVTAETVLLSSDGRGKLAPLTAAQLTDADPRRDLASLTVLMFTGNAPLGGKVPKRDLPGPLADVCTRMLAGQPVNLDSFVDACGTLTRPAPVKEAARRVPGGGGDFGWLVTVVLVVALAVVAVVMGPGLIDRFADDSPSPRPTATGTQRQAGSPLTIASITDFDPLGNGEEHPEQAGRAIDGDPVTEWTTVSYAQQSMDKPGVGLLLDLGTAEALTAVRVQTSLPGWQAEIRVSSEEPSSPDDLETVTSFTAGSDSTVRLRAGVEARFVLVWITSLAEDAPESDLPYRARISEVEVLG